jgi:hypothetical protein
MRRIITIVALVATMLLGASATALAFVPPADPTGNFTIVGDCPAATEEETGENLINSFPGANGQWAAIGSGGPERTVGAWNATGDTFSNSAGHSQIGLCD